MKTVLAPLFLVSERWCKAALASIFDVCVLKFSYSCRAVEMKFPAWPSSIPHSRYRKTHLVKRVTVLVNVWREFCDGAFCDAISMPQFENLSFPLAKIVELRSQKTAENRTKAATSYLNASTLEHLEIAARTEDDWMMLIYGGAEDPMVYASLVSLVLETGNIPYNTMWPAINDTRPFPVLLVLDIGGGYPFNDDLPFRGNGKMLQGLRLPFSALARNALGRFGMLRRSRIARLNTTHICKVTSADEELLAASSVTCIEQQIHCILDVSLSLTILGDSAACDMYEAIHSAPNTAIIWNLNLADLTLDTSQILSTIAALPSLVRLACDVSGCGPDIEAIPAKQRPGSINAKYHHLNCSLRTLSTNYDTNVSGKDLAHVAMLLAIACPRLRTVDVNPTLHNEFSRKTAWCMLNSVHKPYANQLCSLVYFD
ncbi:hypothetical protein GGI20_002396 [Coemansia sp. BCRC 34301]|nr:hypothetical protein GGI20_002396 [Coemansia sp. BCRC 34301]